MMVDESVPEDIEERASLHSKGSPTHGCVDADPFGSPLDPLTGLPMPSVESDSEDDLEQQLEQQREEFERQLKMQYENLQTQLQTLGDVNELEEARVRQNEVVILRLFRRQQLARYIK